MTGRPVAIGQPGQIARLTFTGTAGPYTLLVDPRDAATGRLTIHSCRG